MLAAAGYRVACYTSPHLLRYNERVRIAGREASDAELVAGFEAIEAVRGNVPLTYFEHATLAAMLQGATARQARGFLEEIKEFSELGDSFEEPVKTYSSGMLARLGFTTALKTHVDILLIDEVLSVGDALFREKAEAAMKSRISGDQTVVFVSHMEGQVREVCDRAICLYEGAVLAEGEPAAVLDAYREIR
jgi:lipopolysaccharide transport system ATP-binding protein